MAVALPVVVPGPVTPDDPDAWYASDVRAQYAVHPGVVATVRETDSGYHYTTREPFLNANERDVIEDIESFVGDVTGARPLTRDDAVERMRTGLSPRWRHLLDPHTDLSPAGRRRVSYHMAGQFRALGELTPLALDDRIRIADSSDDHIVIHTQDFAPITTDFPPETPFLDRFLRDRLATYPVSFQGFSIPVTIFRRHLLGADTFDTSYAVSEPELFPGDRELIEETKRRLRESPPTDVLEAPAASIRNRAQTLLRRRLLFHEGGLLDRIGGFLRRVLPGGTDASSDPMGVETDERLDDLTYYVLRDLVGDGPLTIPIRDPTIRAVEANRVGERVKVVARDGAVPGIRRMPSTLSIDDETAFVGLARKLAAEGGLELHTDRPAGTVELVRETEGDRQLLQCAVGLPMVSNEGPHISIRCSTPNSPTPAELVSRGQLTPGAVAAIWMVATAGGAIVFVGSAKASPALAMSAHTPFIPAEDRPISVGGTGSVASIPHETGLALRPPPDTPTGIEDRPLRKTAERNALHPDVEILPDVSDVEGLERLAAVLNTGRGVFAAAESHDRTILLERSTRAGIPPAAFAGIDLVVSLPKHDSTDSARTWVPSAPTSGSDDSEAGRPQPENQRIRWRRAVENGANVRTDEEDPLISRLSERTDQEPDALAATFDRRRRYVEYMVRADLTSRESLLSFLSDLRTDEPATLERIRQVMDS